MARLSKPVGYRVWLGSQDAGYCGCGIIVDEQHVVTCNHVVRQCLGLDLFGGLSDDLIDRRVTVRCQSGLVECKVVRNVPLPEREFGEHLFDDLALLKRVDISCFPPNSSALLASSDVEEKILRENRARFVGTGLGASPGSHKLAAQFISVPFEGRLLVRAEFKYWYHTSEDFGHLTLEKGCSGGAATSVELPDTVLGLIQGGLKSRSGLVIPASAVGSFLEANKVAPNLLARPPDAGERSTNLRKIRKKPALTWLNRTLLGECDRNDQKKIFQEACFDFLNASGKCFFLVASGREQDLPDIFNRKFSDDSIRSYWDWMRVMLNEDASSKIKENYPSITVKLGASDLPLNEQVCIRLLAGGLASDSRLRSKLPDAKIIIDAMEGIDSPIVIFLECESSTFGAGVISSWQSCIQKLSAARNRRPIIAIMFVDYSGGTTVQIPEVPGVYTLPPLGLVTKNDVLDWARMLFFHEQAKVNDITTRVVEASFPLSQLHDWLF